MFATGEESCKRQTHRQNIKLSTVLEDASLIISKQYFFPQTNKLHSIFAVISLCEEDLALATYYMTKEAGCSLPPTELSACMCSQSCAL